jgi:kynurenine formamidase
MSFDMSRASNMRIIDLSLTLRDGMRGVGFQSATAIPAESYNTTSLSLYSHAGTHMDAPLHFIDGGRTIDHIALEKCFGPAHVFDLTHKPDHSLITVADLEPFARRVTPHSRVLLRTDWDHHAGATDYRTHFPRISLELAEWLVERDIWLLGVQSPSVASLRPEDRQELIDVHQTLLNAEIVIVEGLANLHQIRQAMVQFMALPLKLDGIDGSPTRAIAIEDAEA